MNQVRTLCDNGGQFIPRRGAILAIAAAAGVLVYLPLYLSVIFDVGRIAGILVTYSLMATIPFALARAVTPVVNFDRTWFPGARSQWLWFIGMVFALFLCTAITALILHPFGLRIGQDLSFEIPTKWTVILGGIITVLIAPIAEEIFWRGYFLEQLWEIIPTAGAVLIQSLLFGFVHLHHQFGSFASIQAFFLGTVLGVWRIKFRSLLPLMLAHAIFNAVVCAPRLIEWYQVADTAAPIADSLAESAKNIRSNPKCQQIQALARQPAQEAVPAIIDYLGDPDKDVRTYAQTVLVGCFRREAEPHMKKPLSSRDKNTLDGAITVVGIGRYSAYKQDVRDIAWSVDDGRIQLSAVMTLYMLNDEEGLRRIAKSHSSEKIRGSAERLLQCFPTSKP